MGGVVVNFGSKMAWFTIRAEDTQGVVRLLGLSNGKPVEWDEGIDQVYEDDQRVFVAPPVDGWTFVVGFPAFGTEDEPGIRRLEGLMQRLSKQFGEAQAFATHRVGGYHHWILARSGERIRSFHFGAEGGIGSGLITEAEETLEWADLPESEWFPDEEAVLTVAEKWSLDPTSFDSIPETTVGLLFLAPDLIR